jgi:hypothetical protein
LNSSTKILVKSSESRVEALKRRLAQLEGGRGSAAPEASTSKADPETPTPDSAESVVEVNKDTHGEEYYGGSSSISILNRLYTRARRQSSSHARKGPSIVNLLHNPEFHETVSNEPASYLLIEAGFLNVFFDTLHYMHPMIDKRTFMQRCGQMSDRKGPQVALYYSCIALSAITTPANDAKLGGYLPIQWANLYVENAKKALGDVFSHTTLESVQALFLLVSCR